MENEVGIRAVVEVLNQATAPLNDIQAQIQALNARLDALNTTAQQSGAAVVNAVREVGTESRTAADALGGLVPALDVWDIAAAVIEKVGAAISYVADQSFEAQEAFIELRGNVERYGKASGETVDYLQNMASNMQAVSRFSDENAAAALGMALKFGIVGEELDKLAVLLPDIAEMLGTDLAGAAAFAGRAMLAPEASMRQLRMAGIMLSKEQREAIKWMQETGREAEVASIMLEMLAKKAEGRATEAVQTFGGAVEQLSNKFGDMFENMGFADFMTSAAQGATQFLIKTQDVADMSASDLRTLIASNQSAISKLLEMGLDANNFLIQRGIDQIKEYGAALDELEKKAPKRAAPDVAAAAEVSPLDRIVEEMRKAEEKRAAEEAARRAEEKARREQERAEREAARAAAAAARAVAAAQREAAAATRELQQALDSTMTPFERTQAALVETVKNLATFRTASRITADEYKTRMAAIFDAFRTPEEVAVASYEEGVTLLDIATGLGAVTPEQYAARMQKLVDDALPLVTISSRRVSGVAGDASLLGMSEEETQALAEQRGQMERTKAAFDGLATSIGDSLGNAISQGGFEGMTTLQDIVRNTLRGILADILSSGIKNALKSLFSAIGSSGGGGGGLASFFTSLLLPKASGGSVTNARPLLVGEEGPEVFMPHSSGRILSNPTITGMGGSVNYSPQTSIVVNGNALDEKTKEELLAYIELGRARDQRQLSRLVTANNLKGAR